MASGDLNQYPGSADAMPVLNMNFGLGTGRTVEAPAGMPDAPAPGAYDTSQLYANPETAPDQQPTGYGQATIKGLPSDPSTRYYLPSRTTHVPDGSTESYDDREAYGEAGNGHDVVSGEAMQSGSAQARTSAVVDKQKGPSIFAKVSGLNNRLVAFENRLMVERAAKATIKEPVVKPQEAQGVDVSEVAMGTDALNAMSVEEVNKAAGLAAGLTASQEAATSTALATTGGLEVQPPVRRFGDDISKWEPASVAHPIQRSKDKAFIELAKSWMPLAYREKELEDAEVELLDVDQVRRRVLSETKVAAEAKLPYAILHSPAAKFITQEASVLGTSAFVNGTKPLIEEVREKRLPPFTQIAETNFELSTLADEVIARAVGEVILDITPLEAAQRAAAALSVGSENPLVVSVNGSDGRFYVPALQAAKIVEQESAGGGRVLGRSEAIAVVERPGGVQEQTFYSSTLMAQDLQNPDVTIVAALEPGTLPMPGRRRSQDDTNETFGTLEINAVALWGRTFERRMQDALSTPEDITSDKIGVGGLRVVTAVRQRTNLADAVVFLSDPSAIGVVKPSVTMKSDHTPSLTSGKYDQDQVTDGEIVDEQI